MTSVYSQQRCGNLHFYRDVFFFPFNIHNYKDESAEEWEWLWPLLHYFPSKIFLVYKYHIILYYIPSLKAIMTIETVVKTSLTWIYRNCQLFSGWDHHFPFLYSLLIAEHLRGNFAPLQIHLFSIVFCQEIHFGTEPTCIGGI